MDRALTRVGAVPTVLVGGDTETLPPSAINAPAAVTGPPMVIDELGLVAYSATFPVVEVMLPPAAIEMLPPVSSVTLAHESGWLMVMLPNPDEVLTV